MPGRHPLMSINPPTPINVAVGTAVNKSGEIGKYGITFDSANGSGGIYAVASGFNSVVVEADIFKINGSHYTISRNSQGLMLLTPVNLTGGK